MKSDEPKIYISQASPYDSLSSAASSPSFHSRVMPQSPIATYSTSVDPVTGTVTRKVTNLDERKKHQRLKEQLSRDHRASAEKALKERTEIEFFEREKIFDHDDDRHLDIVDNDAVKDDHHNHNQNHHDDESPYHHKQPAFHYPSESSQKLYYKLRPNLPPSSINSSKVNGTDRSSTKDKRKGSKDEISKGESIQEPAYLREYGRISEYPNPDEKLKGWKETGYKIVTEVEYVDKDAHQDKAFETRDKGKAEHVKKVSDKTNQQSVSNDESPPDINHHLDHPLHDDLSMATPRPPPPPPPSDYHEARDYIPRHRDQPSVIYETDDESKPDTEFSSNNKNSFKIRPQNRTSALNEKKNHVYGIPKSPMTHVVPPASVTFLTYQPSASKQIPSLILLNSTISPVDTESDSMKSQNNQFKPPQTTTESTFVTIIANDTSSTYESAPATTSTESTRTSTTEASFRPLRKPPSPLISALHIIDSPKVLTDSSDKNNIFETSNSVIDKSVNNTVNNLVNPSNQNHHQFSKLISIEAPPSVYIEALNRMKEAKAKAEKEAKEKKEREKIAWLSRIVKANAYATQPQLNAYLPYASSSNGYGQYTLPTSTPTSKKVNSVIPFNSFVSNSASKGSFSLPLTSSSSNEAMDALAALLSSSGSSNSVSSIVKNFSPLSSFSSNSLNPFSSNINSGSTTTIHRIRSPLTRLASTLNPRKILPSFREYTRTLTQPLVNVFNPFSSSSNIQNTVLPMNVYGKNRLFPVTATTDAAMNNMLNLLMTHGKRIDSSDDGLDPFQGLSDDEKAKKTSALFHSTFESLVKEYPAISSLQSEETALNESKKKKLKAKLLKSAERREDSDEEEELMNTSGEPFITNNLNDGPDQTVDWIPKNNFKNLDKNKADNLFHITTSSLHNTKKINDQKIIGNFLTSSDETTKKLDSSSMAIMATTDQVESDKIRSELNRTAQSPTRRSSPVASFDQWMKEHRKINKTINPLKPVKLSVSKIGTKISLPTSTDNQPIEVSTNEPANWKSSDSSYSLIDKIRKSKRVVKEGQNKTGL